jgi:hypothetical protein
MPSYNYPSTFSDSLLVTSTANETSKTATNALTASMEQLIDMHMFASDNVWTMLLQEGVEQRIRGQTVGIAVEVGMVGEIMNISSLDSSMISRTHSDGSFT